MRGVKFFLGMPVGDIEAMEVLKELAAFLGYPGTQTYLHALEQGDVIERLKQHATT